MSIGTDTTLKFIIIGEANVGKTSILNRFIQNEYNEAINMTIGVNFNTKIVAVQHGGKEHLIRLQIWDSAGQERFNAIVGTFFRNTHGAVVVYDAGNMESYQRALLHWIPEVRKVEPDVPIVLVANKIDMYSDSDQAGIAPNLEDMEKLGNIYFKECSAKSNINTEVIFCYLASVVLLQRKDWTCCDPKSIKLIEPTNDSRGTGFQGSGTVDANMISRYC